MVIAIIIMENILLGMQILLMIELKTNMIVKRIIKINSIISVK